MIINKKIENIIYKYRQQSAWKPARIVAELVRAGMNKSDAESLMQQNAPERKPHKTHKPHNSHARPVNMEDLSTHYIVVGDYDMLTLQHQDALIAAVRGANGRPGRHDGATAIKLFNLIKSYPTITTAEVNKHLNRDAFIDSIPLYIDGVEVAGEPMPSADNDFVKEIFRAVKQLRKIVDGLEASGGLEIKKYLERVPTAEDVKRAVGVVAPKIINPHFHKIDYDRDYSAMPVAGHREDSKRIINEWKEHLNNKGSSKPTGRTLASETDAAAAGGTDA